MICINCSSPKTQVTNSRPSLKLPSVWRRRHCPVCQTTFTTREEIAEDDELLINAQNQTQPFSHPRLSVSLAAILSHRGDQAADDAFWLAKTIRSRLSGPEVKKSQLLVTTYDVLKRFDAVASLQFAAKHGLIDNIAKPRRGRPRTNRRV